MALLRVVHAIPADSTVDVFADDNKVFDSLAYKTVTPYREIRRPTLHVSSSTGWDESSGPAREQYRRTQ